MAIHIDVLADLERRSVERAAAELDSKFNQRNVSIGADVKAVEIRAAAEKIKREFSDIRAEIKLDMDKTIGSRLGDVKRGVEDVENAARSATDMMTQLGKAGFGAARGLITIGAPIVIDGLLQIAEVGTAATQALWLLPAAAAAAGAGIGTLALATHGFGDAMKHMGDPKKWAEDLQALSPAAQQAALEIKHLVDGPLGALQNATQDAFFKGLPEQIDRLVTTYLPTIQNMTTGIADAFNKMMTGVGNQLMTPETQGSLQTLFNNITLAFQNLAPAAAPFTKALTDIAAVGSDFLPGLATSITNAANSFATFIGNARESGQLHVWIQQGIDAVGNLASALGEIVKIWYHVFGPEAKASTDSNIAGVSALKETVGSYGADLRKISDIFGLLMADGDAWAAKWNEEMVSMQGPLGAFRDMILDIPEAMATAFNGVKHVIDDMMTNLVNDMNHIADILPDAANKALFGTEHPKLFSFTPAGDAPVGDWAGYQDTRGRFGNDQTGGQTPLGGGPNAQRQRRGAPMGTDNNAPGIGQFPVPPPPPAGGAPSDKERRDAIIAGLDPKTWQVDPFAGMPPALPIGAQGGPGAMSNQDFIEGQRNIIEKAHALEEATKNRLALEKDNQASAEEINDAKWKEVQDGWNLQESQQKLIDKMQGTTKDVKSGMDELGAALDPDLGLGKGLSGLADNLVRFLGAVALAGPMAQLSQLKAQNEAATGIQGGFGLLGIQGAKNLAAGNSPLLGTPLGTGGTPAGYGSVPSYGTGVNTTGATMPPAVGGYGLPAGTNTGGYGTGTSKTFPPWVMAVASAFNLKPSTYSGHQETDRHEAGYAPNPGHQNRGIDWSGAPQDMQRFADYLKTVPGMEQVIWNGGGMGTGDTVEIAGGRPQPGYFSGDLAGHGNHVHTRQSGPIPLPGGGFADPLAAAGDPTSTGGQYSAAGLGSGSLPLPLPVTIVGAGGGGGGLAGLFGGGGGGGAGAAAAFGGGGGKSLWDSVAQAESSGNWFNNDTGGNGHFGGLQFSPSTWKAYGGTGMPNEATREQQIEIANRAAFTGYNGTPPQGLSAWQAITDGKVPGVTTGTPAAAFSGGGGQSPILKQWQPGVGGGLSYGGSTPDSFAGLGGHASVGGTKPDANPNWFNGLLFGEPPPRNNIPLAGHNDNGLVGQWGPPGLPNQAAPGTIGGIPVPASVAGAANYPPTAGAPGGGGRPAAGPTGVGTGLSPDMANPTPIGGLAPAAPNPGGGGVGITPGGSLDTAMNLAASAFPGVGQAAATGMKLASRAIQYGGQMAGIGVEGLMQTFLPSGGSELANNSWLTRIVGGLAGASPALPNLAGGKGGGGQPPGATPQPPLTPDQAQQHGQGGSPGPGNGLTIGKLEYNNVGATEDRAGADLGHHLGQVAQAPMGGIGTPR